ncbi:hypothetical protein [Paenibacillus curdlanolyticus]|uniref:hypothetical protein n=1 Tax=Paenibacillus curdlanolyticus TaxID=59840 RepID=UPI0006811A00|nr:hypothetical protein [Paenibacillus curdlanolyticus]
MVTVVINGGRAFPNITQAYSIRFYPGITIANALRSTGVVTIGPGGQIISVSGIPIVDGVHFNLLLNGRQIPSTLLNAPLQRGDTVALELFFRPGGRSQGDVGSEEEPQLQYVEERNYLNEAPEEFS